VNNAGYPNGPGGIKARDPRGNGASPASTLAKVAGYDVATTGWRPSCTHADMTPVPQTVLDPFGGAGTVGLVADRLQCNAILCELNPSYADMGADRIVGDAPLFSELVAD
jgi:hypothetical protein